ncbi:MAG: hypothetical protein WBC05_12620 [Sedimentisphaerales bacterium]
MKAKEADLFDTSEDQISTMYEEIGLLSKKKPDGPVNKFKLKFINDILKKVNKIMGAEYMPFDDFNTFDEDALPTASDVVFILSQYLKSMDKFRFDNTYSLSGDRYWRLPGRSEKKTRRPNRHV